MTVLGAINVIQLMFERYITHIFRTKYQIYRKKHGKQIVSDNHCAIAHMHICTFFLHMNISDIESK